MGFRLDYKNRQLSNVQKKNFSYLLPVGQVAGQPYQSTWPVERAIQIGMQQNVWVFRAVHAVASNAARLPFVVRRGHPQRGPEVPTSQHPIITLLNDKVSDYETAYAFRYRLSSQILLSRMGAFIQLNKTRGGELISMSLLPPGNVVVHPGKDKFVDKYVLNIGNKQQEIAPEEILWIKLPHPSDPYSGMTPLEAAGLAVETDIMARKFNRNFLQNDIRPGSIIVVKGGMEEDDARALKNKFSGSGMGGNGYQGAGRLTVIDGGDAGAEYIDTSITPRDAQYKDMMEEVKQTILTCFGTPESVLGNASGRTYDNAAAEGMSFWRDTMNPHLMLIASSFNTLTPDEHYADFDTSDVYVLDKDERDQFTFYLNELKAGAISIDSYLQKTGQDKIGDDHRYISKLLLPYDNEGNLVEEVASHPAISSAGGGSTTGGATDLIADDPNADPSNEDNAATKSGSRQLPRSSNNNQTTDKTFDLRVQSWKAHVGRQMEGFFRRQERVVLEKLASRKSRMKWDESKDLSSADVFDYARWNEQLADDAQEWLELIAKDFDISLPKGIYAALLRENDLTTEFLDKFLKDAGSKSLSFDDTTIRTKEIFDAAIGGRASNVADAIMHIIVTAAKNT